MEQENMTAFTHTVTPAEDGLMLHQVLRKQYRFSRRLMTRMKMNRLVTVNGEFIYFTARVKTGDEILIRMQTEETDHIPPQPIHFAVVHEDEDLIVIDKPPGLVVHPTRGYPDGTLANGLMHYWAERGEKHRMRPVTRLDRDTSGLLVVGKHAYAHAFLAEQMAEKRYERIYLACAHHPFVADRGTINKAIHIHPDQKVYRSVTDADEGYPAITHFEVMERFADATLVRLSLETGRTHQIRVHLSSIGHPIIGDEMYGTKEDRHLISRQALHATYLKLFHPRWKEWMAWESPLPEDMRQLVARLREEHE
ncbi:RluA family pseudouridine synthase [Laceyella putida]|uniref:Pseudouridine synthase n=1 Tax=Laceyella putida TaxID=110101 RepID=A0ABW2RLH5_9BACL